MPPLLGVEFKPQVHRCATGIMLVLCSEGRLFALCCPRAISWRTSDGKEVKRRIRASGPGLYAKEPSLPIACVPGSRSKILQHCPVHSHSWNIAKCAVKQQPTPLYLDTRGLAVRNVYAFVLLLQSISCLIPTCISDLKPPPPPWKSVLNEFGTLQPLSPGPAL